MKNKNAHLSMILITIMAIFTLLPNMALAQLRYSAGVDYNIIENPLPLNKFGQKEVVVFFTYQCSFCYQFEPAVIKWADKQKPKDVGFYQIPAVGGYVLNFTARVKYVADKLGLGRNFDHAYFEGIHKYRKRNLLGKKDAAIDMMVKYGADKAAAEKAWDSLSVKSNLKRSEKLWQQAKLTGTPSIIVNGKYLVMLVGDYKHTFDVINFLLETTEVPQ